jgi:hypothetical protein
MDDHFPPHLLSFPSLPCQQPGGIRDRATESGLNCLTDSYIYGHDLRRDYAFAT